MQASLRSNSRVRTCLEAEGQDLSRKEFYLLELWTRTEEFCHADAVYGPLSAASLTHSNKDLFCHDKDRGLPIYADSKVRQHASDVHSPTLERQSTQCQVPCCLTRRSAGDCWEAPKMATQTTSCNPRSLQPFSRACMLLSRPGKAHGSWPMDSQHDVSSIRMVTHKDANIPREANQRKAQEYANYRRTMLPGLTFAPPRVQHTPVDILPEWKTNSGQARECYDQKRSNRLDVHDVQRHTIARAFCPIVTPTSTFFGSTSTIVSSISFLLAPWRTVAFYRLPQGRAEPASWCILSDA